MGFDGSISGDEGAIGLGNRRHRLDQGGSFFGSNSWSTGTGSDEDDASIDCGGNDDDWKNESNETHDETNHPRGPIAGTRGLFRIVWGHHVEGVPAGVFDSVEYELVKLTPGSRDRSQSPPRARYS